MAQQQISATASLAEYNIPDIRIRYCHANHEGNGVLWIIGDASVGDEEIEIGCWEDKDDDGVEWCAADEGLRVYAMIHDDADLDADTIDDARYDGTLDAIGRAITAALREAFAASGDAPEWIVAPDRGGGYTGDVTGKANCHASQGGTVWVEYAEIDGEWYRRAGQSNGRHTDYSKPEQVDECDLPDSVRASTAHRD